MLQKHWGFSLNYLYSLYDALVSISVPSDKARAVVDAMERDMGTTLATKQDLEILRREMENHFTLVEQKIDSLRSDVSRDITALGLKMTVKLGSMLFLVLGFTVAVLRLWS